VRKQEKFRVYWQAYKNLKLNHLWQHPPEFLAQKTGKWWIVVRKRSLSVLLSVISLFFEQGIRASFFASLSMAAFRASMAAVRMSCFSGNWTIGLGRLVLVPAFGREFFEA
jgi:hypothetical protein